MKNSVIPTHKMNLILSAPNLRRHENHFSVFVQIAAIKTSGVPYYFMST